jgi:hypothetical protein
MAHHDQSKRCTSLVATGGEADITGSADSFASVENGPDSDMSRSVLL